MRIIYINLSNVNKALIYNCGFIIAHEMYHVIDNYELPNDEYHRIYDIALKGEIDEENEDRVDIKADEFMKKYGKKLIKEIMKI